MKKIPVAVQLYSVRDDAEKDLLGVLQSVKAMGYDGVEFAGDYGHSGEAIRKMLDECGLEVAGSHTRANALDDDRFEETIAWNQAIGNRSIIIPWLGADHFQSRDAIARLAERLNALAVKLKPYGMEIGYHNHVHEFETPIDGLSPWELLFDACEPEVVMQLDVGHATRAGADPVKILQRHPQKAKTVHLKEFSPENDEALLGEGVVAWNDIFRVCESEAATEWYIVEQERYPVPPMESVKRCMDNLRGMRL